MPTLSDNRCQNYLKPSIRSLSLPTTQTYQEKKIQPQESRPAESTHHFDNHTIRSRLFTHFCSCQGIEEVMNLPCKRLPTCLNLTLCQMLKANQTLLLNILIVVVVTIDLAAMFTRSSSPCMSVLRTIRKLHFQRLFLPIKVTSKKCVQLFSLDHPQCGIQFPTYVSAQVDADVSCSFLSQCGPELCKTLPVLLKSAPLSYSTVVKFSPNRMRVDDLLN